MFISPVEPQRAYTDELTILQQQVTYYKTLATTLQKEVTEMHVEAEAQLKRHDAEIVKLTNAHAGQIFQFENQMRDYKTACLHAQEQRDAHLNAVHALEMNDLQEKHDAVVHKLLAQKRELEQKSDLINNIVLKQFGLTSVSGPPGDQHVSLRLNKKLTYRNVKCKEPAIHVSQTLESRV